MISILCLHKGEKNISWTLEHKIIVLQNGKNVFVLKKKPLRVLKSMELYNIYYIIYGKKILTEYTRCLFFDIIPSSIFCIHSSIIWQVFVKLSINLANEERRDTKTTSSNFVEDQKHVPYIYNHKSKLYKWWLIK